MLDRPTAQLCRIAVLTSCNRPEQLRACLCETLAERTDPLALYETLLQTYLFAGFPAALEGLRILRDVLREMHLTWMPPAKEPYDLDVFRMRGEELYTQVYASNHDVLRTVVESFSPDMFEYMIVEGYGKVLSRPGLSGVQRELASVTALTALGWERQTISHARGAMNLAAEMQDVVDAINLAEDCAGSKRVKSMLRAVEPHLRRI